MQPFDPSPAPHQLDTLTREVDWSRSPLGHPDDWPPELRTAARICLSSSVPMAVAWGPEFAIIYNEAFRPFLGKRHPAYGRPHAEVFPETWDDVVPTFRSVVSRGRSQVVEDYMFLLRNGERLDERYFSVHVDPLYVGDTCGGVMMVSMETTARVLRRRRERALRRVYERAQRAATPKEAAEFAANGAREDPQDVPFAAFYVVDRRASTAHLQASVGLEAGEVIPSRVQLSRPGSGEIASAVGEAVSTRQAVHLRGLGGHLPRPAGCPWDEPPSEVLVLPVRIYGDGGPTAVMVVGLNPHRELGGAYRVFCDYLAAAFSSALAAARRRQQAQEFEAHFGLTGVGNAQVDVATARYVRVNEAFCQIVGYPEDEIIGRTIWEVGDGAEEGQSRRLLAGLVRGERPSVMYERRFRRKDGTLVWTMVVATIVLRDGAGRPVRAGAVIIDISDHRRAERALADSEARYRALALASTNSLYRVSVDGRELLEVFGGASSASTQAEPYARWLGEYVHPDDRDTVYRSWLRAVARGEIFEAELRARRPDGAWGWMLTRIVPVRDAQGEIAEWIGSATDVTDRREAEERLKFANESMNRFLSIASHELRNPVAAVHGTAQQLARSHETGRLTGERLERYIATLQDNSAHLARLTADLLDVTRLQQGRLPLRQEEVDPASLLRDLVAKAEWPPRVDVEAPEERLPRAFVDPDRFRQVVTNLVDNALKYSPESERVVVTLDGSGEGLRLDVVDRGIGLPPDAVENLFRPFGRAPNAVSSEIPGLGLGLYVARQIVAAHRGWLWAYSEGEGKGATMTLWLPSAEAYRRMTRA